MPTFAFTNEEATIVVVVARGGGEHGGRCERGAPHRAAPAWVMRSMCSRASWPG
jgi:hypothetical protein